MKKQPLKNIETCLLTTGIDTLVGTAGNDTFNAADSAVAGQAATAPTFTALDSIDGGAGIDTLNIIQTAAIPNVSSATVKDIEVANLTSGAAIGATGAGNAFDTSAWTGLTNLNVLKATGAFVKAANTTDVTIANAGAAVAVTGGKSVTIDKDMMIAAGAITVDAAGDVTVTATKSNAGAGGITIGATTAVTGVVNVSSTGADIVGGTGAKTMDAIAVTGGTTVNVAQSTNSASGDAATKVSNTDVVTQGAVTVTGTSATKTVNVTQDAAVAAVVAVVAVEAVKQTEVVTFAAVASGVTVVVDGLSFTASKALTAAQVAEAFAGLAASDKQDAGGPTANGFYTGSLSADWTSGAASGSSVTFTAAAAAATNIAAPAVVGIGIATVVAGAAGVAGATAVTGVAGAQNGAVVIKDGGTASITDITVDGYSANAILGSGGQLNALANLTLKNAASGIATLTSTSTTLNVTLDNVNAGVNLGGSVTNLTVNTSGKASTGAITADAAQTITINAEAALSGASTFTAAKTITVKGSATVNLTGAITDAVTLTTIDASGNTGGVTAVLGASNVVAFTGGAGADSLTLGAAAVSKNIDMGAGDDTLVLSANTSSATITATTVNGGDGVDTLSMGYADAVANSANQNFDAKVTGFERLTINNVVGADDDSVDTTYTVNLANLAYNYVTVNGTYSDAGPEVDTLALTGMAANGTVAFGSQSTAGSNYTVALADATGSADVINYVVGASITSGTVTTNAVETFNISSVGVASALQANGDAVTSIIVSGSAGLTLTSTATTTTVTTVDASAMTAGSFVYTANNGTTVVTGGAGNDKLTAAGSGDTLIGGAGNDTLKGADLTILTGGAGNDTFVMNKPTNVNTYSSITDLSTGDIISLGATSVVFQAAGVTLAPTAVFQDYANAAANLLGTDGDDATWFQFGGNTYIVQSGDTTAGNDFVNGSDSIIQIVGTVDLSTASYNQGQGTLEIA